MFDAIHVNVGTIPADAVMVAGYDTGSADIKWVTADWNRFINTPGIVEVHIDQANGGPVHSANVMDVESGAYSVADMAGWESQCTAPRPTAYVNGSELDAALAATDHEIWLADPGITDAEALAKMAANPRIVAIQNVWTSGYDISIVGDPTWPEKKVVDPPPPPPPPPTQKPVPNLRVNVFAVLCQGNVAWNAAPDPDKAPYEWQLEFYKAGFGWVFEDSGTTTDIVASMKNLSPARQYRIRVSNGVWSDWVEFTTP
jgi:hypothetical protein